MLALIATLGFSLGVPSVEAAWYTSRVRSDESGEVQSHLSRTRYSSAIQKEIRKLDDTAVKNLPVPILLGMRASQLSPNFGDPRDGGARTHEGEDIMAPRGSLIASPTDAVVTRTGTGESSGIYVYTANPGGETFVYMHLEEVAVGIKAGTVLKPGDILGYVGDSGNAKGTPHLHFEIRKNREALDPYPRLTREFTLEQRITSLQRFIAALKKNL